MDKKKLMILGTSIISLLVIIGLSIFLLLGTKEEKNPKEEEEKPDLSLNEDLNIDEELLFEYNKESMLGTSSTEVKLPVPGAHTIHIQFPIENVDLVEISWENRSAVRID